LIGERFESLQLELRQTHYGILPVL
jgi:hypothetical protein